MSSHNCNDEEDSIQETSSSDPQIPEPSLEDEESAAHEETAAAEEEPKPKSDGTVAEGREKLKRHRVEVAGRVWIPDMWGQEELLKDWIDCAAFDAALVNSSIIMARDSLMEEPRRSPNPTTLRVLQN